MQAFSRQLARVVAAALLVPALTAQAGGDPAELPKTVVTATRTAQTQDQTLAAVTVITREDIERLQPVSLMDLLAATPGISISNNGGYGKAGSVFLRGTSGAQTLVLVDGVRMGAVSYGGASLPYIPLDQIERIEIVRGPFSSLYGADAVGGVVQIFLRHDSGAFSPNASLGVGSYNTVKGSAGFARNGERGFVSVQASHRRTDGINTCRVGAAAAFAGCFMDAPDKDGFDDTALTVNGGYRFNDAWSFDGVAFHSEGTNDYDVYNSDGDEYSIQTVGGQLHYAPSQRVKLTLRAGSNTDFTNNVLDGAVTGHFNSRRSVGGLQADIGVGTGLLSVGYDWEKQSLLSNLDYAVTGRIIRGAYAQWQASFGAQSVQANLRRDDNSQFGDRTTGSLLWGWELTETLRLTANYGTAFRAPSFNDLYFPGYGTATLKPESSRNLQLGLRGTPAWGHWSLEAYRNEIKNLIEFNAATYSPGNIGRARITGLEGVIGTKLADWNLSATATLMQAHDRTPGGANRGHTLPRRAERSAHFDADRRFGAFSVGASWQVAGRRFDDIGNQHPLGGYGLLNLRGGWQLAPAWHLDLALNNAFDKRYETAWYFNQPGRNFMLTLNWQPRD